MYRRTLDCFQVIMIAYFNLNRNSFSNHLSGYTHSLVTRKAKVATASNSDIIHALHALLLHTEAAPGVRADSLQAFNQRLQFCTKMSTLLVTSKCKRVRTTPPRKAGQGLNSVSSNLVDDFRQSGPLLEAVFHAQSRPVVVAICSRTTIGDAVQPCQADAPSSRGKYGGQDR